MSAKRSKKNSSSTVSLIATIIVAVAAMVLAIVAIFTLNGDKEPQQESSVSEPEQFRPSEELVEECTYAAHDLVADSYSILRLFVTEGLPHYDEPYGNEPEDGIYTVNSAEYTSLAQIEELVNSVYIGAEAERILTNLNGMAVYKNRQVLVDIEYSDETGEESATVEADRPLYTTETVLGIDAKFVPDPTAAEGWSECIIVVTPVSETECGLKIYLGGITAEEVSEGAGGENVLETAMLKVGESWKLAQFVY